MKKLFLIFIVFSLILTSCSDWLDINEDPNNPTEMQINKILPGVYFDIAADFGLDYGNLGYVAAVYTHQLTTRESYDQYGVLGSSYAVETFWDDLYTGPLQDLEVLIDLAEDEEIQNTYYAGIAKVMKVYIYSQMVDLWGDIPYTEANEVDNFNPKFDDQKAIYTSLFALLEEAIADLQNEEAVNFNVPGSDDLIYGGNMDKWVKAAKSLQLVMYNKVQFTDLYDQSKVNALLEDELIGPDDNFMVPFGTSVAPDNRNPAFVSEYAGGQISNYISPWFYEILKGENDNIFVGIEDPRIPYYFAEQLDEDNPETETLPEYRNGYFVSIYFGSVGSHRDGSGRKTFTMMGLYPVGGAFNNDPTLDRSAALGISAGTGAAPFRMITNADILYVKAELALKGKNPGADAGALLEDAINASFSLVDRVTEMAGADAPAIKGSGADTTYVNSVMTLYNNASDERKLEIIMTQKWISLFGTPIETYNDYRRTGYPVLFDPNTMGAIADGGPDGSGQVPVQSSRAYALSFPYSADELSLNSNAPAQKNISQYKIFWDN